MVLQLNLHELTLREITEFIKAKCSQYGTVLSVSLKLFPRSADNGNSFAVVEMSSAEENSKLRATVGDEYIDKGVLVHLVHDPKQDPKI